MRTPSRMWTALVAAALLLLAACGNHTADTGGSTVKVAAVASGPFTQAFNPLLADSGNAVGYANQSIYEPLLQDDFAHGVNRPWLVTSYAWSGDGLALDLKLRHGVAWSDGRPFTSEDLAFTFELIRTHAAFNGNGLPLAGASAPRPDEAVIAFTRPAYQVMWWRTLVVPKHVWEGIADPVKYVDQSPVGTGPYVLQSFTPQVITLKRNAHYWQAGLPRIPTVQYLAFDSDSSMVAALAGHQVDWIGASAVDPAAIAKHDPAHISYWVTKPNASVVVMLPNHMRYPLDQPAVRRAISLAIDREKVTRVGMSGLNEPVVSPTGLDVNSRADALAPEYKELRYGAGNASAARQALTTAGFQLGSDGIFRAPTGKALDLELLLPSSSPYADLARASQVMVAQLRAAGIGITVRSESQVSWRRDTALGNFELTMRPLGGTLNVYDLFDRIFDQDLLVPVGKNAQRNYERYRNPQAGALLQQYALGAAGSAGERQARTGLERLMVEDVPVIPLFFTSGIGMWRTDSLSGFPSRADPYAVSVPDSVNSELVLLHLRPNAST